VLDIILVLPPVKDNVALWGSDDTKSSFRQIPQIAFLGHQLSPAIRNLYLSSFKFKANSPQIALRRTSRV